MDPLTIIFLLVAAGIVLLALETLLPTHGLLGLAGVVSIAGGAFLACRMHAWAGVGLLVALVVASPFVFTLLLKAWERSPVGKRVTLNAVTPPIEHEPLRVGDEGRTLSELRPMGEAEFGPISVQVVAHGNQPIGGGRRVRVVAYHDGVATVEPLAGPLTASNDSLSEGN